MSRGRRDIIFCDQQVRLGNDIRQILLLVHLLHHDLPPETDTEEQNRPRQVEIQVLVLLRVATATTENNWVPILQIGLGMGHHGGKEHGLISV